MTMKIVQNLVSSSKYSIKCPYTMTPEFIVVHNTANDASAANEIAYMIRNDNQVSYHYAIDDKEIVQGIPENRNSWNSGDGKNGDGNRKGISIEICYSKSGGERFIEAEKLAAKFIAFKLKEKGWGIEKVKKHQDFSGKYCPHRTLDLGWDRFLKMIKEELTILNQPVKEKSKVLYRVQAGAFQRVGYAQDLANKLKSLGFETIIVQSNGLYKVQVGAYSIKENAEKTVEKLKKRGYDAFITTVGGTVVPTNTKTTNTTTNTIKVGSKVKVKNGAKTYEGKSLASFVYSTIYEVIQIDGNRVVIGKGKEVTAAVHKSNLILV